MTALAALLLLVAAAVPPMVVRAPAAFSVPLLDAKPEHRGTSKEGILKVVTAPASQVLYWSVPTSKLEMRAQHERGLVARAGDEGMKVRVDEQLKEEKVAGARALSWSADIEKTHFESTVVDCTTHHVLLTTMGPDAKQIREIHAASLAGLSCSSAPPKQVGSAP